MFVVDVRSESGSISASVRLSEIRIIFVLRYIYSEIIKIILDFKQNVKLPKQFVVTNCSKERPCSIVTETLENGILISINLSKDFAYYADSKYITFIKFSVIHQKLRARENVADFRKKVEENPLKVKEY